jgi:hypothetical protein
MSSKTACQSKRFAKTSGIDLPPSISALKLVTEAGMVQVPDEVKIVWCQVPSPADAQLVTPDPFVCRNCPLLPAVVGKVKVQFANVILLEGETVTAFPVAAPFANASVPKSDSEFALQDLFDLSLAVSIAV